MKMSKKKTYEKMKMLCQKRLERRKEIPKNMMW